jgi:hypothetical protein
MEQWKHLRVANEQLPPLLIKGTFGKHGYSIRLTDLSRIWIETLSRDEIITRARKRNCSVDPGEDSSQNQIFLDKLQSSLNQDSKTNLAFSATNDGQLKLHLEAPLPSPLPTFEWEVDLNRAHDSRTELLIAELQAKDKVIAKVTDRLETSGHDLTAVFPGVSNVKLTRGTSQQEQLGRHIRGLGKFDEKAWKAQLSTATDTAVLPESSEDAIFASLPQSSFDSDDTDKVADWWQQIPAGRHIDLNEKGPEDAPGGAGKVSHQQQDMSDADVSQQDDFQRQATPPRLHSKSLPTARQDDVEMGGTGGPAISDEDSTEDEDDLDRPSQKPCASHKRTSDETKAAEVAQVSPKSPSPSPPLVSTFAAQPSTTRGPFTHEEDTEDDEDDDDDDLDDPLQPSQKATSTSQLASRQKSQTSQPTASTTKQSPPRKALGKLGGRLPTKAVSRSPTPPLEEDLPDPTPTTNNPSLPGGQPKPKPKLGTIGGARAKTKPQQPSPPPPTTFTARSTTAAGTRRSSRTPEQESRPKLSRQQEKQQHADKPVEPKTVEQTEAERADAKREALKRELESKAKAPVKKKRKF